MKETFKKYNITGSVYIAVQESFIDVNIFILFSFFYVLIFCPCMSLGGIGQFSPVLVCALPHPHVTEIHTVRHIYHHHY